MPDANGNKRINRTSSQETKIRRPEGLDFTPSPQISSRRVSDPNTASARVRPISHEGDENLRDSPTQHHISLLPISRQHRKVVRRRNVQQTNVPASRQIRLLFLQKKVKRPKQHLTEICRPALRKSRWSQICCQASRCGDYGNSYYLSFCSIHDWNYHVGSKSEFREQSLRPVSR